MYSDARSRILGIVHSPLPELSGVGGGSDPVFGVNPADPGVTNAPKEALAGVGLVWGWYTIFARPFAGRVCWLPNAMRSFCNARCVFARDLAH